MDSLGSFERERGMYHFVSPILRFLQLFTLVASFSAITSASQNGLSYASYDAFKYLIAATVIATIWTLVMLIVDSVMLAVGKSARFAVLKHILLKLDFVAASLTLSAAAASAAVTMFNDKGGHLYPTPVCAWSTPWGSFCARTKAAVSMAFIAFFLFLPTIAFDVATLGSEYFEPVK